MKTHSYLPDNGLAHIPSRDEFHRTFSHVLYAMDFNTIAPNPCTIARISQSVHRSTRQACQGGNTYENK